MIQDAHEWRLFFAVLLFILLLVLFLFLLFLLLLLFFDLSTRLTAPGWVFNQLSP